MASSAAVYGDHHDLPKSESSPTQPISPYAWQKLTGEFYGRSYCDISEMEFAALRYFNVYGPRQDPSSPYSSVLSIFIDRAMNGLPLNIFGDGFQTRDFIHVSDVADINLRAVEATSAIPSVVCIGTGKETSVIDAAKIIINASCGDSQILYHPERSGDIKRSYCNNELLGSFLDYEPAHDINQSLATLTLNQQLF